MNSPYAHPPRLVLVTDHEWLALSMETLFAPRGYAVRRAATRQQAVEQVKEMRPDVVILGRTLRDSTGVELCQALRKDALVSLNTPIVLLSPSPWDREESLAALRAGAWETCVLPLDAAALFLRIDVWVRAKLASDAALEQGLLDATGVYNVQGLLRRIAEMGAVSQRHHRPLGCVVIEPDLSSSDRRSELTESEAAAAIVPLLRSLARSSDAVGRLSATEFVIIAPETDGPGVLGMAERLLQGTRQASAATGTPIGIRCGCYAATDFGDASIAPTEMLIRATEALRRADQESGPIQFFGTQSMREMN